MSELSRAFRNFVAISFVVCVVLAICLTVSAFLVVILVEEVRSVRFTGDIISDVGYFWRRFIEYWIVWWDNKYTLKPLDSIVLSNGNISKFFIIKLFAATIFPVISMGTLILIFRAPLMDWRPFRKKESLHGDAKWATDKDIEKAGLRAKKGMLLGTDTKGNFLVAGGFQHALLFAPTGSGKGVGFVIPNLLFWEDSCFIHDIKLENYELTSGWRKEKLKQNVYLWNPADSDGISHCYNPLQWISLKPGQMVDDVQKIANILLPDTSDFWESEARSLFTGIVLYLCAVPEKVQSFGEVVRTLRSDDVVYNLAVVLDTIGKDIHPVSYMNIASFLQKADKERSGVISTLNSKLELWANPLIDTATATSDFNISDFKRQPTTVYVGVTPDNLKRLQPLLQVFYQQATEFLARSIPTAEDKYGVLFMMDEFPTLGKMDQFKAGIAYFRGYKLRLFLIVQDTEQLKDIYEDAGMNSFLSNSTYRITFAANNVETAELISKMVGNKTVEQVSANKPKFLDLNPGARSLHVSETQRALLLPQEVVSLDRDLQILLIEASPPIKSKKIKYYKDSFFTKRLLPPIFVPTQEPYDPRKHGKKAVQEQQEVQEEEQAA
ncbi:MAG: type IV secretion system protein VirD4 [Alphaproteobacteria bacterium CG11_big_fil_rev_8_21_14_0_20_39_49]|nr:MAG: type IV secretion system protein VirD4 [Alphaproteobacteria bacterium CG11_big_fil_rev_8_21_14_0_20_39_49]